MQVKWIFLPRIIRITQITRIVLIARIIRMKMFKFISVHSHN